MIYLIYVTWESTENNHAGMRYLCHSLAQLYPEKFTAIESLRPAQYKPSRQSSFLARLSHRYWFPSHRIKKANIKLAENLRLTDKDTIVLMEYMDTTVRQYEIARIVRRRFPSTKIYGLSHLVPSRIDKMFNQRSLTKWVSAVDSIVTLGSSLTRHYVERGVSPSKLITTFHYVDPYYKASTVTSADFKVLVQGSLKRDLGLLQKIVEDNPDTTFVICQGMKDLSRQFSHCPNVRLMPYLQEEDILALMQECAVSLNVMKDTIGSNVIVTSMAAGQAMVCSDVGSIRDYCDTKNCIFCTTLDDFSHALQFLKNHPETLFKMREASLTKSENFLLSNFSTELSRIIGT